MQHHVKRHKFQTLSQDYAVNSFKHCQSYVIFSALPPVMVPRTVGKVPTEPPLIDDYSNVVPANTNFPTSTVDIGFPLSGQL